MYGLNMHSNKYAYGLNRFSVYLATCHFRSSFSVHGFLWFLWSKISTRNSTRKFSRRKEIQKKSEIRIFNFGCLSPAHYFLRFFLRFLPFRSGMKLSWREIRRGSRWDKGGITVTDPIGWESILNQS